MRCFIREAFLGLSRALGMNALTIGIIAASLAIVGGFLILLENLERVADEWNQVQIHAYLKDDAVENYPDEVLALVERLRSWPGVRAVDFVSRREALAIFRSTFSDLAEAVDTLQNNPLPASIEIAMTGDQDGRGAGTGSLIAELRSSDLVEIVQDNRGDARRLMAVRGLVLRVGAGVGAILITASIFITFSVIRLAVGARREEIGIMRLVGATPGFIRGPFLVEGLLQGGLGAGLALLVLYLAHLGLVDYAHRSGNSLARLLSASFLPAPRALELTLGGLFIGLAGSALSLRRFLDERTAIRPPWV
ncbi:MAG: cell division protein FtsX [Acidobacteriota bacterium]